MKNAVTVLKMTAARWPSSAICGGLPFPQAGRPDNGNYLDGGSIIVELQIIVPKDAVIAAK